MSNTFSQLTDKFDQMCNEAGCYDYDEIFNVYRCFIELRNKVRNGKESKKDIEDFSCLLDNFKKVRNNIIYLWPNNIPHQKINDSDLEFINYDNDFKPFMSEVLVKEDAAVKGAILLVAGGKHGHPVVSEALASAIEFVKLGYQCFIVHHRINGVDLNNIRSINPLDCGSDINRAIKIIKHNAQKYRINEDDIFVAGFSNGGTALENYIQYFSGNRKNELYFDNYSSDEIDEVDSDIKVAIYCYGARHTELSFDWQGINYPKTFIAVGLNDTKGYINSVSLLNDLTSHDICCEFHSFVNAPHGFAGLQTIYNYEKVKNYHNFYHLVDEFISEVK